MSNNLPPDWREPSPHRDDCASLCTERTQCEHYEHACDCDDRDNADLDAVVEAQIDAWNELNA